MKEMMYLCAQSTTQILFYLTVLVLFFYALVPHTKYVMMFFFPHGSSATVVQGLLTVDASWSNSVQHVLPSRNPLDEE